MSWIRNGYAPWRGVIDEHYGKLSEFKDASTIRIQLETAKRELSELERFFVSVQGKIDDSDPMIMLFREDEKALRAAIEELLTWLAERELTP